MSQSTNPCIRNFQGNKDKRDLDLSTEHALGPEVTRTRDEVHLEQYVDRVEEGSRRYDAASSLERRRTIVAPVAQSKECMSEREYEGLSKHLTSVSGVSLVLQCADVSSVRLWARWQ